MTLSARVASVLTLLAALACSRATAGGGTESAGATGEASSGLGSEAGEGSDSSGGGVLEIPESCLDDEPVVFETPEDRVAERAAGMTRYATVSLPGHGEVLIYAQDQVSELQIRRARSLLKFFVTDVAGSMYGDDKGAVFDSMIEHGAVLMMPNGAHEEGNEPALEAQPLYADETPVEGSRWYLDNDWEHRDAAFEEIFHLVHDVGIGTFVRGALPGYQAELLTEAEAAVADGRWGQGEEAWLQELEAEGSLAQEYIASVLDTYYGLWGAWDETPGGMWGIYVAKTRDELDALDPRGRALLEAFLPEMLGYEARLDPAFEGTFSMAWDASLPYTHKSQYLLRVTLTGSAQSSIRGNAHDNTLRGNTADNRLDGAAGDDVVVFCRPRGDYEISTEGAETTVSGPEGVDTLVNVESIRFADAVVRLAD